MTTKHEIWALGGLAGALLVGALALLLGRGTIGRAAVARDEARARELEAPSPELDRLEAEVAELRSSTPTRSEVEAALGEVQPLFGERELVLGHLREVCRKHAAKGSFDPVRDVRILATTELGTSGKGPRRLRAGVQLSVVTEWAELASFLDDLRASPFLLTVEDAAFDRDAFPRIAAHVTLAVGMGEGAAR